MPFRRSPPWAVVVALPFATTLALAQPAHSTALPGCRAWPGEVEPLPTTGDPDLLRAQWAVLRMGELTRLAAALESVDPLEAHRLWNHARCLDPEDRAAREGAQRTRRSAIHRPALARDAASGREALTFQDAAILLTAGIPRREAEAEPILETAALVPEPAPEPVDAIEEAPAFAATSLDAAEPEPVVESPPEEPAQEEAIAVAPPEAEPKPEPLALVAPMEEPTVGDAPPLLEARADEPLLRGAPSEPPPVEAAPPPQAVDISCGTHTTPCAELVAIDDALAEVEALIRHARFDQALESIAGQAAAVDRLDVSGASRSRRIRIEVLRATAALALGHETLAHRSLVRVLDVDPSFELDPLTSPKIREALEEARRGVPVSVSDWEEG